MKSRNVFNILIGTALILLVPLVAMQVSDEVDWNLFDFVVIGTLLVGSGLMYEFVASKVGRKHRPVLAIVFVGAVLLIWAELAVGVFGSPFAGS